MHKLLGTEISQTAWASVL